MLDLEEFLSNYHISKEKFDNSNLNWDTLKEIYDHYEKNKSGYNKPAKEITSRFLDASGVHSTRYRIKNSEHLIEKIISKTLSNRYKDVTVKNYTTTVTDLIGIRALHLFKNDFFKIDDFIKKTFEMYEDPIIYIRKGDNEEFYKDLRYEIQEHKKHYRSVHYLIIYTPTIKEEFIAEIQVRTLFDEGWGEIDHIVRYPHGAKDKILEEFLFLFNHLTGISNEMGNFVKLLDDSIDANIAKRKEYEKNLNDLQTKIDSLEDKKIKGELTSSFDDLLHTSKSIIANLSDTVNISDSIIASLSNTCDKCQKTIDSKGTSIFVSNLTQCPICKRYLCQECWPRTIGVNTISEFMNCPDCREIQSVLDTKK